jgi:signal transduction histidine kinase
VRRFQLRAGESARPLAGEAPAGLRLRGDRLRLEQAMGNLVDNALRHGRGRVALRAAAVDGKVELSVRDQGEGFGNGFVGRAFERFSRARPSSEGAGLGLSIVRVIAEAHGGSADAENAPEGGAHVRLMLPR